MTANESTCVELQTRYGKLQAPDDRNDLISRFLLTYGEWAPYEVRFVAGAIAPGARVADIGAFIGTFGLGLMTYQTVASVCFVEANPRVAPLLRNNVSRHAKVPCVVVEAVVVPSLMHGSVIATVEADNAGSFSITSDPGDGRVTATATDQQFTLGDICREYGPFDLIKLDIEGLEDALLRDEFDFIRRGISKLWVECNQSSASLTLCQTLLDAGLDVYYCAFPVSAADNYNGSREVLLPWAYEAGLWATRGEMPRMHPVLLEAGCIIRRVKTIEDLKHALWDTPHWAPAAWVDLDAPGIVAHACHTILGERFEDHLHDGATGTKPPHWARPLPVLLYNQIVALQDQLAQAHSIARANEIMLHAEREFISAQGTHFATDIAEAARAGDQLRDQLAALRDQLAAAMSTLAAFEGSTVYRVIMRLRLIAARHPRLFQLMRPVLRLIRRVLRRR